MENLQHIINCLNVRKKINGEGFSVRNMDNKIIQDELDSLIFLVGENIKAGNPNLTGILKDLEVRNHNFKRNRELSLEIREKVVFEFLLITVEVQSMLLREHNII